MIRNADEFIRLRSSQDPADYLRAANDDAPLAVWRQVIARRPDMRSWVAHNKTVPVEILSVLACDPNPEVRFTVAMKNKLPPELFLRLAGDDDETVRQRIAHNKNTPADVLRILAADNCSDIAVQTRKRLADLDR